MSNDSDKRDVDDLNRPDRPAPSDHFAHSDNLASITDGSPESERNFVLVTHGLYAASLVFGFTAFIGVVLAYVKRGSATPWAQSHYVYAIRTFWIGLLFSLIGVATVLFLIGIPILLATAIWMIIRVVVGILRALKSEPIVNPSTWLI